VIGTLGSTYCILTMVFDNSGKLYASEWNFGGIYTVSSSGIFSSFSTQFTHAWLWPTIDYVGGGYIAITEQGTASPSPVRPAVYRLVIAATCTISAPTNGIMSGGSCGGSTSLSTGSSCTTNCNSGYGIVSQFTCTAGVLTSSQTCLPVCISSTDSLFTSLIKRWSFEDIIGSSSIYEQVSGSTVSISNGVLLGNSGISGSSLTLNGQSNSYVYVPSSSLPLTEQGASWSISLYFKGLETNGKGVEKNKRNRKNINRTILF
jgi:hypothetical protein